MFRTLIASLFVVGIPISALSAHGGGGGHGGGGRGGAAIGPLGVQFDPHASSAGGVVPFLYHGSRGFPLYGVWGGYGGYSPDWFYGPSESAQPGTSIIPATPAEEPQVELSNEFPAILVVQLPTEGEVWVNGNKGLGNPTSGWTLTSPILKLGQEFKFQLTARWVVNGKTYEYKSTIPVASGNRSKVIVITGEEVK